MKKNISKVAMVGVVIGVAALIVKEVKNIEKNEKINKRIDVKNLNEIKAKCNEKLSDKLDKINDLRSSLFNKQSSTSVVFRKPTVYENERDDKDDE